MRTHANGGYEHDEDSRDLSDAGCHLTGRSSSHAAGHHVPVYFHDSVVEAVRRSRSLARERGVAFVATLALSSNSDAAVEVLGDPFLLEAMVADAVGSALRASPMGSRVELDVQVREASIVLCVRDHGTGAAAFATEFGGAASQRRSSGYGLDLARRVAAQHRGTVSLRSVADGGCEYCIRLPRWRSEGPPPLGAVAPLSPARSAPDGGRRRRPARPPRQA